MEKNLEQEYGIEFEDVTSLFQELVGQAAQVSTGYLLAKDYSLNELASEIEIANKRTDFRFNNLFSKPEVQIAEKRLQEPETLTEEQLIWVFDQTLLREVAYIDGMPLCYCFYDFA